MPIDAHTLAKHPWMKYINQEELLKPQPYDGHPKHKLRKMLIEKDEFIKDIMDNIEDHPSYDDVVMEAKMEANEAWNDIEKHPDYEDVVGGFEIQLQEYRKEVTKDLNEEIRDLHVKMRTSQTLNENKFQRMKDKNESLEKKVNSQMRVAKMVNKKLHKQIRTMKDDWAGATNKMGQQISDLTKEVKELKQQLRDKNQEWMPKLPNHNEDKIKQQKQLIDYYELREDYFEKFIEGWESGCHEWREFCEARAHKTGNEEHVGILFDD